MDPNHIPRFNKIIGKSSGPDVITEPNIVGDIEAEDKRYDKIVSYCIGQSVIANGRTSINSIDGAPEGKVDQEEG